jgi:hypothetical protein
VGRETDVTGRHAVSHVCGVEALAVVTDREREPVVVLPERHGHRAGLGVPGGVREELAREREQEALLRMPIGSR